MRVRGVMVRVRAEMRVTARARAIEGWVGEALKLGLA